MLVRESHFWGNVITPAESERITAHARSHGLVVRTAAELSHIEGDSAGQAVAIHTTLGERIPCQVVGITTGVQPNVDFLRGSDLLIGKGIVVNDFLESNIAGVYAAGDCAEIAHPMPGRRSIEPVWYTGRMMGEALGATLAGVRTPYRPGPWFNSAKFFDMEYQTYGQVQPRPGPEHAHWHVSLPGHNRFATVAYHPDTLLFHGINAFGIRLRHAYFHDALRRGDSVTKVVGGIHDACFDGEFSTPWHKVFKEAFTRDTGIELPGPAQSLKNWFLL
jgi:NADPH-dependent 2,4-dienoyl-CoA reductase/sulfur reductase-like enzyme